MRNRKSFTQTFIEDWLVKSSSQKSPEEDLPPWASQRNKKSFNLIDSDIPRHEEDDDDNRSTASLTGIIEEAIISNKSVANNTSRKAEQEYAYSIIANDLLFPDEKAEEVEDKVTSYTTAQSSFSPSLPDNDGDDEDHLSTDSALYRPHLDPEYDEEQYNDNIEYANGDGHAGISDLMGSLLHEYNDCEDLPDTVSYKSDNINSLPDTIPYKSENEDSLPDTIPYRSEQEDSLPDTIPYKSDNENSLPDTVPYKSDEDDLPDTDPYRSDVEDDLLDTLLFESNNNETTMNTHESNLAQPIDYHSMIPEAELPLEEEEIVANTYESRLSSKLIPDFESHIMTNAQTKSAHTLELRLLPENLTQSTDSTRQLSTVLDDEDNLDYFEAIADEEIMQLVDNSAQTSATKSSMIDGKRKATSPLLDPVESQLARLDKKQLRSSAIKKPTTIDDYFSLTTGLRNDSQTGKEEVTKKEEIILLTCLTDIDEIIGKESQIPSFSISSNEDIKKSDSLPQQDYRRRPRFGISKKAFK